MSGGVALPHVPEALSLAPSGADDTMAIQHAIDQLSVMPLKNGFCGAVVLAPGTFLCTGTLNINASGVVLRGNGPATGATTLKMTGEPHLAIAVAGKGQSQVVGNPVHITEDYVPSGMQSITVDDGSSFGWETPSRSRASPRRNGCTSWAWTGWSTVAGQRPLFPAKLRPSRS